MESNNYPGTYYQPLFDLLNQEHGITPLESEMTDIIEVVEKMRGKQPGPRWVKAIDRNPPVNTRLHLKVKGVNHVGFWDAPANCYVTFLDNAYPITDVEWLDEQPNSSPVCEPDFIEFVKNERNEISKEMLSDEWWLEIPAEKRVKFENVLIAYDQMVERLKKSQPAAGREEDAVAFAEWIRESGIEPTFGNKWVDFSKPKDNRYTTAELYELFKQQKENP